MYRKLNARIAAAVAVVIVFAAAFAISSHLWREPDVVDLIDAIQRNQMEEASALIAAGVGRERYFDDTLYFDAKLTGWYFPIHAAASHGRIAILDLLLEAGADPNQVDFRNETPVMWAVGGSIAELEGRLACLRHLVNAGANLEAKSVPFGETALHKAAAYGLNKLLRELIALGAHVNARRADGNTPLHEACVALGPEREHTVRILLAAGAHPNLANDDGMTPRDLALKEGRTELAELLSRMAE